jgi:predicted nucleic-acid-binding protein
MDDNTRQAAVARQLLESSHQPLLIAPHILCEMVWVLNTGFRLTKVEVVDILQVILVSDVLVFEQKHLIQRALDSYQHGRADFSDYLIGEIASAAGCRDTVTFDRVLKGSPGFTLL